MEQDRKAIRILLVEDDEVLSTITAMGLRREGYQVLQAMDGQSTLDMLATERIDLVLLDVLLPDMDGHEICRRIRNAEVGYDGPIIFMSCMGDSGNIVDAFREGGNDYIVKPANPDVLLERIRVNLEEHEEVQEADSKLWFNQFVMDTKTRSVYRVRDDAQQEKIELSRTEYDILLAFVNKPDEILLYRQLYKAVWGMEDMGDVRTLMVHVSNLRKKVDTRQSDMIRAIRGVGYLFQDK